MPFSCLGLKVCFCFFVFFVFCFWSQLNNACKYRWVMVLLGLLTTSRAGRGAGVVDVSAHGDAGFGHVLACSGEAGSGGNHRAGFSRTYSRRADNVRAQQEKVLADLKRQEMEMGTDAVDSKMPIQGGQHVETLRRDGEYNVHESSTHVIKIQTLEDATRTRIKQLIAGGASGAITKTAVAPLERIKILLQVQGMKNSDVKHFKYRGIVGSMRTVVQDEGFLALYRGNGANVLRVVPVYALKFTFNDTFKDMVRTPGEDLSFVQLICAGTLAGLFQTFVTYPLETVRTRLTIGAGMGAKYTGIVDVLRQTVRHEGVAGLYKGIGPTILSGSPYVGLQMSFYEIFKRRMEKRKETNVFLQQIEKLLSGAAAGVIAQTITYPGDTVRKRMQMNGMGGEAKLYTNSWDCTKKIVRAEGVKGLFNGLGANLVRCLPGAAIQFWAYDLVNSMIREL